MENSVNYVLFNNNKKLRGSNCLTSIWRTNMILLEECSIKLFKIYVLSQHLIYLLEESSLVKSYLIQFKSCKVIIYIVKSHIINHGLEKWDLDALDYIFPLFNYICGNYTLLLVPVK